MYIWHQYTGAKLTEIATYFNIAHYSAVSQAKKRLLSNKESCINLKKILALLSQDLTP